LVTRGFQIPPITSRDRDHLFGIVCGNEFGSVVMENRNIRSAHGIDLNASPSPVSLPYPIEVTSVSMSCCNQDSCVEGLEASVKRHLSPLALLLGGPSYICWGSRMEW
jgi:hypothetical protein